MTFDEYEKLPSEEKEHFARCTECGEIFDRRSLDEVLFHHTDHNHRPDIQYSGSEKLRYELNQSMKPTAPLQGNFNLIATAPCRGLSLLVRPKATHNREMQLG